MPAQGVAKQVEGDFTQIKVTGKVRTPWFGDKVTINVAWRFLLNSVGQIFFVAIDVLASPEELLNLKPDKPETEVHHSDGRELIPSEVPVELPNQDNLVAGYTKDDEGIINNYALEPAISSATYPTPKQQVRYIFWGIGAIVFVGVILFIAFSIS